MAEYQIPEEKRPAVEEWIDRQLLNDDIQHLEVCRKRGAQHSKIPDSEIDGDELHELGTGEAVLDRCLDSVSDKPGRFELRVRFVGYNKSGGKADQTKAFHMRRVREPSTKSQGSNAATEQLATSLAAAFDQQSARSEMRDARFSDFMQNMMLRSDETGERRLSEHSSYQMEIMRLQGEIGRRDMQIALMDSQGAMPPEVWVEVLKAAVPMVGDLVGTVKTAVTAWGHAQAPAAVAAPKPAPAPKVEAPKK
jgi:hypothetical protein